MILIDLASGICQLFFLNEVAETLRTNNN